VGIIAVNLMGEVAADEEQHHLHAEVQHAQDRPPSSTSSSIGMGMGGGGGGMPPQGPASMAMAMATAAARPPSSASSLPAEPQDLAYQLSPFDPETTRQLAALTEAKEAAVRVEDYDTAKRLKVGW
jgi:hypothetical protein